MTTVALIAFGLASALISACIGALLGRAAERSRAAPPTREKNSVDDLRAGFLEAWGRMTDEAVKVFDAETVTVVQTGGPRLKPATCSCPNRDTMVGNCPVHGDAERFRATLEPVPRDISPILEEM